MLNSFQVLKGQRYENYNYLNFQILRIRIISMNTKLLNRFWLILFCLIISFNRVNCDDWLSAIKIFRTYMQNNYYKILSPYKHKKDLINDLSKIWQNLIIILFCLISGHRIYLYISLHEKKHLHIQLRHIYLSICLVWSIVWLLLPGDCHSFWSVGTFEIAFE